MPKAIKKRDIKKITVKEEGVKDIISHIMDFIRGRKKTLILLSSVAVAVIVIFAAFKIYTVSLAKKAYSLEIEAANYYYGINLKSPLTEAQRWEKSLELYQQSLKLKPTPVVQFYIGNCYYKLRDYSNAINTYIGFISKYSEDDANALFPLVYWKLASSYIGAGKNDDALKTLQRLKEFKKGTFKGSALFKEAQLYEAMGKPEDSQKRYEELIKEFPNSPLSAEARLKMRNKEQMKKQTP
ncbi:MAG: tetratricopeptide repeat protein [Nitrospirae bacterium]|nr:tetratricopeptide repeat protein [Nitrospirota bacterium]